MKKLIAIAMAAVMLATSSCASMLSKSVYSVKIDSTPSKMPFIIYNGENTVIAQGVTPEVVDLEAGSNMVRANYQVEIQNGEREYVKNVVATVDGWAFLNFLLLPFFPIGLGVDADSGAAWKLPKQVHINLSE